MKRILFWCAKPMMLAMKPTPKSELTPTATQNRHCTIDTGSGIYKYRWSAQGLRTLISALGMDEGVSTELCALTLEMAKIIEGL